ncbi:peptidoglycan DD-metalloendopeptidase family protein [Falsibacillus pallidus]|uniref:peptidoglycan DD-metalloendopeptidase family protein n=1 Tax=Falsibacillus pallidus TaxID=493781 RepID=UPI003D95C09A
MSNRADEIRKRIAKRKNTKQFNGSSNRSAYIPADEEKYGGERFSSFESGPSDQHPLWNKEVFLFKILLSAVLVLGVAVLYRGSSPVFKEPKKYVEKMMSSEFQFAAVSDWYQEQFGKPLALFPNDPKDTGDQVAGSKPHYAVPAGKVLESFRANGRGIMLETESEEPVVSLSKGVVIFAGKKDDLGNTVIIQHPDKKTESWYGHLDSISVSEYESVEDGMVVGKPSKRGEGESGEFYLAIKKGDEFVDPLQVISLE